MTHESLLEAIHTAAGNPKDLWAVCEPALASTDWQLRKLATQALGRCTQPEQLLPHLLAALRHPTNAGLRNAAAEALELLGSQVVSGIIAALEHEQDDDARKFLVETLGALRSPAAAPRLATLAGDISPNVRLAAIEALGKLNSPTAAEALLRTLDVARETTERFVALQALTQCARAAAGRLNLRLSALAALKSEPLLTRPLLQLLAALNVPEAERFLWTWLSEFDELRAQEIAKFLGTQEPQRLSTLTRKQGVPKIKISAESLRSLFGALDKDIAAGAIWLSVWLGRSDLLALPFQRGLLPREHLVAAVALAPDDETLGVLIDRRDGYNIEHLDAIIEIIGRRADRRRASTVIQLASIHPALRPTAFRWGAELGCVEVLQWLLDLLHDPDQLDTVADGLGALIQTHPHEVMALLRPWSESIRASDEWRAFLVLVERLNLVELRSRVELAWKRADPDLRAAALQVLARFRLDYAQHYLALALADESEDVRLTACEILADVAGPDNASEVRLLLNDRTPWIRAEAIRTLMRIFGEQAENDLRRALDDPADIVRIQAIRSLRALNNESATESVRLAMRGRSVDVICEALRYLATIGAAPRSEDTTWLAHHNWRVRLEAVAWLGTSPGFIDEVRAHLATETDGDVIASASFANRSDHVSTPQRARLWFRALSDHVYEQSGITMHAENRNIYERRVNDLRKRHGFSDLRHYYLHLRYHPRAADFTQELIEAITTGETYFYRESRQLEHFFEHTFKNLLERARKESRPVRLWSAGCSSGEEPYTLAMMALEAGYNSNDIEILGGDINHRALRLAREGVYRDSAFRVLPIDWRQRYFEQQDDGRWRIRDRVRSLVEFAWMNLMRGEELTVLPTPDAIFCRNVLIYFDRDAKTRAIANLHRVLHPQGVLLLGHAESLLHIEHGFAITQTAGEITYIKALT